MPDARLAVGYCCWFSFFTRYIILDSALLFVNLTWQRPVVKKGDAEEMEERVDDA